MSSSKRGNKNGGNVRKATKRSKGNNSNNDGSLGLSISEDCPVLVQWIDYGKTTKVPSITLTPNLGDLLFPLTSDEFLKTYFRRKAVHISCDEEQETQHADTRVSEICQEMCGLDAETILRETSSDSVFIWLRGGKSSSAPGDKKKDLIQSIDVADPDTAVALHKTAGHATYCRAPPKVEQSLVASLLRETGLGCGQYDPSGESIISMARGEVETFISTDNHFTNWHFDFQENFTIQLSGIKRWTLQQGSIRDPIRGCTPHYAAPGAVESQLKAAYLFDRKFQFGHPQTGVTARGDVTSVALKPGDVFYFPAGMWHKVETIEPGVSINVSLMASNYATVTCQALQQYLFREPKWREPVLNNSSTSTVDHLKRLLKELPAMIQNLENNGRGAESIIPPILRNPPRFQIANDGDDEWGNIEEEGEGEDGDADGDEEDPIQAVEDDKGNSEDDESNDDDDGNDFEDVVDPTEFARYPADWNVQIEVGSKITFFRNPLAALHRMREITRFFKDNKKNSQSNENSHDEQDVFVLNINFAGNEMYQSAVRVVFRETESGIVQKLYDWERKGNSESIAVTVSMKDYAYVKFLIYHGYLHV